MSRYVNRRSIAVAALVLLFAGGAYAYWTNGGSGTGDAETGTATSEITVVQTSTPEDLYPGGPAASLAGKFDNANDSAVHVNTVGATISSVSGAHIDLVHPCTASDYQLNGFPVTVNADIPSGTAQGAWGTGTSIQLLELGSNQDGCKDATVHLAYTSN
jgi:hypothetical protein